MPEVRQAGAARDGHAVDDGQVRGTQSFVHTMSWCWQHPSLTALEVLWRWIFGIPALWVLWHSWLQVRDASHFDPASLSQLTVTDPMGTAAALAADASLLLPPALHIARWLAPVMVLVWIALSAIGRTVVLKRVNARLQARPVTLIVLGIVRIVALAISFAVWAYGVHWAARVAVARPLASGGEPNLVLYFAMTIFGTLGMFVLWSAVSWLFSAAPLLAMLRNLGPADSLRAALRLGPLKGKLVEINLVMGIVKIALIVLSLVFSACPLPFTSVATQDFMNWWLLGVAVFYLLASDFFQVARLVAYLDLWREYQTA